MILLNEVPQTKHWNELTWTANWTCLRHQTGFYFIFIPFYLGEWCDRRIFTDFWILNKLVMGGMPLQSLSSEQALPSEFTVHGLTQSWSKLGTSGSSFLGIHNCLVGRGWTLGLCHERNEVHSKIYVLGGSYIHLPLWSKWEEWKEDKRKEIKPLKLLTITMC